MPVKSLDEKDLAAAREAAVLTFSDWEINVPGLYLVFEQSGDDRCCTFTRGEVVKPTWQQDFHAQHSHEDKVSSVGIHVAGELDPKKLNNWIGELLRTKGGDIYRMKGVLVVKGAANRLVFQGVHMLFDAKLDRPWGNDPRMNTLVFIGKNLDRSALTEGFKACLPEVVRSEQWVASRCLPPALLATRYPLLAPPRCNSPSTGPRRSTIT
jgi:G3E family GTPase